MADNEKEQTRNDKGEEQFKSEVTPVNYNSALPIPEDDLIFESFKPPHIGEK